MKNLGKTLVWAGMLAAAALYGGVSASVDETRVSMGETVTLTVKASGQDVQKPVVGELCGQPVLSTSQGTSMQMMNGKFTKEYTFSYTFAPMRDCTLEPITLQIDGKEERTEAISIRVVPMTISKDDPFILAMRAERDKVRVGEPFKVTITFKQRRGSSAVDSEFVAPQLKDFWLKEQVQSRRFEEGDYTVTHLTYVLAAQKSGTLSIDPARLKIATRASSRDAWGQWLPQLKWRTYFSNTLDIEAEALPEGVNLVGDFTIEATADKSAINPNEAVNVTLRVSGVGNFEDIGSLKPAVAGVSVFDESPEVKGYIEQGEYKGSWVQKLAFVSDRSFTVPPVTLTYFDTASQSVRTVRTESIAVTVNNPTPEAAAAPLKIERSSEQERHKAEAEAPPAFAGSNWMLPMALGVGIGLLTAIIVMLLPWRRLFARNEDRMPSPGDTRAVLMHLLPHREDPEVAQMVERLEAHLYGGVPEPVDKKALKALLKRFADA